MGSLMQKKTVGNYTRKRPRSGYKKSGQLRRGLGKEDIMKRMSRSNGDGQGGLSVTARGACR